MRTSTPPPSGPVNDTRSPSPIRGRGPSGAGDLAGVRRLKLYITWSVYVVPPLFGGLITLALISSSRSIGHVSPPVLVGLGVGVLAVIVVGTAVSVVGAAPNVGVRVFIDGRDVRAVVREELDADRRTSDRLARRGR